MNPSSSLTEAALRMKMPGAVSVCFHHRPIEEGASEWYIFPLSNDDFKYKQTTQRLKKEKRDNGGYRFVAKEGDRPEDHHHHGNVLGMGRISPCCLRPEMPEDYGWGVLGSKIYYVGGVNLSDGRRVNDIYCFDLSNPSLGFQTCPPMICARRDPHVVALARKLYVLSNGDAEGMSFPCGEVFDPESGEWEALPPRPPSTATYAFEAVADEDRKRIILSYPYQGGAFDAYNVETKQWEILRDNRDPCLFMKRANRMGRPVVVGKFLYWLEWEELDGQQVYVETMVVESQVYSHTLNAYDMDEKVLFKGTIQGLRKRDCDWFAGGSQYWRASLAYLGGDNFCLTWSDRTSYEGSDSDTESWSDSDLCSYLHCLKFSVRLRLDEQTRPSVEAWIESCQCYLIDHPIHFGEASLMKGKFGDEHIEHPGPSHGEVSRRMEMEQNQQ